MGARNWAKRARKLQIVDKNKQKCYNIYKPTTVGANYEGVMMARIDAESYALLDEARELLVEFKQQTAPDQVMDDGTAAWKMYFALELLIGKLNVMVNNRVAAEMTEAHADLQKLVDDLTALCA